MKAVVGWVARKAALYIVLVAAITLATVGLPWLSQLVAGTKTAEARTVALEQAYEDVIAQRDVAKRVERVERERVERGRVVGPDRLVGFSADIAYSVTRTETFLPYFFGREPLLKDRVESDEGVVLVEEAPLSSRSGGVRRGLEGLVDAGMKVFGL